MFCLTSIDDFLLLYRYSVGSDVAYFESESVSSEQPPIGWVLSPPRQENYHFENRRPEVITVRAQICADSVFHH